VKKPRKKGSAKFAVKLLAAVLACAVVSLGSVGVFAAMIQNGVVNIESTGSENTTAAFTIYKQADSSTTSTTTVTGESMTAQEVAQKLIPSVVCIQNYQITQQSSYFFGYSDDSDSDSLSPTGEGSGIIISKDGYIVTNQHVIDGATSLKVVTSEGLTYEAELIGEDTQTDLAVIKITTDDELTPAEFGSSDDLQVADEVMAIGNPGGLQLNSSVTFGRVSALNREITNSDTGYTMKCIQTDAAINPGNSGGALVDMNGHVVGINSSKIVATGYEGLGFAIPSDTVQPIVSDLIEYGYVKDRPMLGISGQYIDRLTASFYGMNAGYYVAQVNSENAAASGLKKGDMITAIDDTQVTSSTTISNYIVNKKPGDTVTLTVDRMSTGESGVTIELVLSENTGSSTSDALGN
jgi:serine protease Do